MADRQASVALRSLLEEARSKLENADISEPALDSRLLVAAATGLTPLDLVTSLDHPVPEEDADRARTMIARRIKGEPVHRILGCREFYGLELSLSEATLEPRPDTETLVDLVLPAVRSFAVQNGECRILDLGTGTGAIALALLHEVPQAHAVGADISASALATAAKNARRHGLEARFETLQSDWFAEISGKFHIIVANPPYIATKAMESLDREVRLHDPRASLDGGEDGLEAYRTIAAGAVNFLYPGGLVAVETGYDQKRAVTVLFERKGFRHTGAGKDLSGHDRALLFAG